MRSVEQIKAVSEVKDELLARLAAKMDERLGDYYSKAKMADQNTPTEIG